MERVKVKSSVFKRKGTRKDNSGEWVLYEVTLEDGRKGDCFEEVKEGQEYNIEIKPNGNPSYNPTFHVQKEQQRKGFAPKDYTFEKKRAALELAISMAANKLITLEKLNETRDKFFAYLNEK